MPSKVTKLDYTPDAEREAHAVEIRGTIIQLAAEIPGWVLFELGAINSSDDIDPETGEPKGPDMAAIKAIFMSTIDPADQTKFQDLLRNASPVIGADEMMSYLNSIMTLVSGRPTEGQEPSPGSLPNTPTGSTAGTGQEAATPDTGSAL